MTELEYWTQQIVKGRINRREFMGRAAALGVTTALASTILSGLGVAATPNKGGSARFALSEGSTTDTLDPAGMPDMATQVPFWGAMSNSLTETDAKGNVIGDLMESMEPADNAKTWVFKLRKGVTFHNGKNLTTDDVIASFRHHMGAESKSAVKTFLNAVTDIKADGPETVIFTLEAGNADFPYICGDYHISMCPANANGSIDWQSGVRTGPYILESWEPGVKVHLKRNPNYHKSGRGHFEEVTVLTIHDITARTNALMAGDVDWIARADLKTLDILKQNPDIAISEVTGYGHYVFPMMTDTPPFDNNDVRLALKWAIDREDIAEKVFLGHATPGNDNPIAQSAKFAIDPKPKYSYDPEKAKFHLKKAGLSSLKVDLSVADAAFNGAVDAALLYKEHAKKAGIDINVIREPNDAYYDNVWLRKPWCASYWNGRPSCDLVLSLAYAKDAAWNETHYSNPHFNEVLVAARSETDDKKRAVMYAELQQILHDDGGVITIVFYNYVDAYSKKLAHDTVAPNWEADGFRISERWWFA